MFFLISEMLSQEGFRLILDRPDVMQAMGRDVFEVSPNKYLGLGTVIKNGTASSIMTCSFDGQGNIIKVTDIDDTLDYVITVAIRTSCLTKTGVLFAASGRGMNSDGKSVGVLMKFDLNGNRVWKRVYTDPTRSLVPYRVIESVDGGCLIAGYSIDTSFNYTDKACLLIKTDSSGTELWRKEIFKPDPNFADVKALVQDSASKKIVLFGLQQLSKSQTVGPFHCRLILDSLGNQLYRDSPYDDLGSYTDAMLIGNGDVICVGYIDAGDFQGKTGPVLNRFGINTPVPLTWSLDYYKYFQYRNTFNTVAMLSDGSILVAGTYDTLYDHKRKGNIHYMKVNKNGQILWDKLYDYSFGQLPNYQECVSTFPTADGGWISSIQTNNPGKQPLMFIKYTSSGCDTLAAACATDLLEQNDPVESWQFYPNPAHDLLFVSTKERVNVQIEVSTVLGQKVNVRSLVDTEEGTAVDISSLRPGLYFLRTSDKSAGRKFIKE